jgi:hypothetical protein
MSARKRERVAGLLKSWRERTLTFSLAFVANFSVVVVATAVVAGLVGVGLFVRVGVLSVAVAMAEEVTAVAVVIVVIVVEGALVEIVAAVRVVVDEREAGMEEEELEEEVAAKGISTNVGTTMPAGAWISDIFFMRIFQKVQKRCLWLCDRDHVNE